MQIAAVTGFYDVGRANYDNRTPEIYLSWLNQTLQTPLPARLRPSMCAGACCSTNFARGSRHRTNAICPATFPRRHFELGRAVGRFRHRYELGLAHL